MIFKWMNESEISIEGDRIEITAPPKTDFFCGYKDFGYKKILHVWGIILVKSDCTWNCGDDHRAVASA